LELLNPQRTLDRGYAVLMNHQGQALRDPALLKEGQSVDIHLALGSAQVELSKVQALAKNKPNE
jgi:exodeoxyribonuclease VII large subunit